jgi:hypothetical protein
MIDQELETIVAERNAYKKEALFLRKLLDKIVNQVHRDGGYCTQELGIEQSTNDACDQVYEWFKMEGRYNEILNAYNRTKDVVYFLADSARNSSNTKELEKWVDVLETALRGGR